MGLKMDYLHKLRRSSSCELRGLNPRGSNFFFQATNQREVGELGGKRGYSGRTTESSVKTILWRAYSRSRSRPAELRRFSPRSWESLEEVPLRSSAAAWRHSVLDQSECSVIIKQRFCGFFPLTFSFSTTVFFFFFYIYTHVQHFLGLDMLASRYSDLCITQSGHAVN